MTVEQEEMGGGGGCWAAAAAARRLAAGSTGRLAGRWMLPGARGEKTENGIWGFAAPAMAALAAAACL